MFIFLPPIVTSCIYRIGDIYDCDNCYYEKFGQLPISWSLCKFGDIVNIIRGASPRPIKEHITSSNDGIPWIKIGDTKPGDIYINRTAQKIKKESAKKSVFLKAGTLVLSNSMSFGRPYILKIDGCIHDGWLAIQTFANTIDLEFLQYILQGYMWFFKSKATGTGVDNLNIDRVKELPFALPPLNEQKRILKKLRLLDEILKQINNSIDDISLLVDTTKAKILDNIFNDNSSYKSYYTFRDLFDFQNGYAFSSSDYSSEGTKVIRISDLVDNKIDTSSCKRINNCIVESKFIVKNGDLLIAMSGATTGKMGVFDDDEICYLNQRVGNIKIKDEKVILPKYRNYLFMYKKNDILKSAYGGAQPNISSNKILDFDCYIPSIKVQNKEIEYIEKAIFLLNQIIS